MLETLNHLLDTIPQQGTVEWIGVRPAKFAAMVALDRVKASATSGLDGDRYQGRTGARHATLVQAEHLAVIASCMGIDVVPPAWLRRNIVVRGINLIALKGKTVRVGSAILEITDICHPCSRMEKILGVGGYNAVRGHGGLTARVLTDGVIAVGDLVSVVSQG